MTARGLPRHQLWVVALLTLVALVRGGYWAVTLEAWSPADEAQHFGYVESLASGDGIPTVGHDRLSDEVMAIAKASPTYFARSRPYTTSSADGNWGAAAQQYEGIQGPTYYALMVPAYWAGSQVSTLGALYAVRLASVVLGALAVPLAWALARRLLPGRPLAWLLGPALLVAVNGLMATAATISNDTIVITGTAAALLVTTWALTSARWWPALLVGATAGLVFVGKSTALGLFPLIGLVALVQHRAGAATTEGWFRRILAAGAGTAIVTFPWIGWNLVTYQAISGAAAAEAITGSLQETLEPGLDTLRRHWTGARVTFWEAGLLTGEGSYRRAWDLLTVGLGGLGLVAAARRWRRPEALTVAALGLSFPVAFAAMVGFLFFILGGSGLLLGRYVYVALVPLLLGLGAAALALAGPRWAPALVAAVVSMMLWQEIDLTDHYLTTTYEQAVTYRAVAPDAPPSEGALDPALAPVVDQSWNDGLVRAAAATIDAPCPVEVLQVGLERPPEQLALGTPDGVVLAHQVATFPTGFTTYQLEAPRAGRLRLEIPPGTGIAVSAAERVPAVALEAGRGDPLVRAWCRLDPARAAEIRFGHTYDPQHPPLTRATLRAWPRLWFGISLGATAALALAALRRRGQPG